MPDLLEPLHYEFFVRALIANALVGAVCAVVGTYVVLKGLAFIGDAISHAAFPGIVVSFIFRGPYLLGAGVAAVITSLAIGYVSRHGKLRVDTAVGVIFAGMFALGIFLYSTIQTFVGDITGFLFGNILAISAGDLVALVALGGLVLLTVVVLWKELLYGTFDPLGAAASGLPVELLENIFLALVAITIVISLQAVGIILVVALLVTPAATAQMLTVRFGRMMQLAIAIGVGSGILGLYASFWFQAASGATIVLVQTALFLLALAFGPRTGLFHRRAIRPLSTPAD